MSKVITAYLGDNSIDPEKRRKLAEKLDIGQLDENTARGMILQKYPKFMPIGQAEGKQVISAGVQKVQDITGKAEAVRQGIVGGLERQALEKQQKARQQNQEYYEDMTANIGTLGVYGLLGGRENPYVYNTALPLRIPGQTAANVMDAAGSGLERVQKGLTRAIPTFTEEEMQKYLSNELTADEIMRQKLNNVGMGVVESAVGVTDVLASPITGGATTVIQNTPYAGQALGSVVNTVDQGITQGIKTINPNATTQDIQDMKTILEAAGEIAGAVVGGKAIKGAAKSAAKVDDVALAVQKSVDDLPTMKKIVNQVDDLPVGYRNTLRNKFINLGVDEIDANMVSKYKMDEMKQFVNDLDIGLKYLDDKTVNPTIGKSAGVQLNDTFKRVQESLNKIGKEIGQANKAIRDVEIQKTDVKQVFANLKNTFDNFDALKKNKINVNSAIMQNPSVKNAWADLKGTFKQQVITKQDIKDLINKIDNHITENANNLKPNTKANTLLGDLRKSINKLYLKDSGQLEILNKKYGPIRESINILAEAGGARISKGKYIFEGRKILETMTKLNPEKAEEVVRALRMLEESGIIDGVGEIRKRAEMVKAAEKITNAYKSGSTVPTFGEAMKNAPGKVGVLAEAYDWVKRASDPDSVQKIKRNTEEIIKLVNTDPQKLRQGILSSLPSVKSILLKSTETLKDMRLLSDEVANLIIDAASSPAGGSIGTSAALSTLESVSQ